MLEALVRRLASAVVLGLALGVAWLYVGLPARAPAESARSPQTREAEPFHSYDRAELPPVEEPGPCAECHGSAPHRRSPNRRAFLNRHYLAMDCAVCHLTGRGVAVRRYRGDEVVTAEALASGSGGRLFAVRKSDGTWTRVVTAGDDVKLRDGGPTCAECHRRGSLLLAADGAYDSYRRRLLEDLSVLRRIGERGP